MAKRSRGPTLIQQSRRVGAEQKALYHQVLGAGKSHVKRPFVGLTEPDARIIALRLEQALQRRIQEI